MQNKVDHNSRRWLHLTLLWGWIVIGIALRFANLVGKSPSSIEIATLGYSLGHSFFGIPLEQVIGWDQLLLPLRFEAITSSNDVLNHLMSESTHPPLYFLLTHLWLKLFSTEGELVSVGVGRSLSAIFGIAAIPAMFGFGWLAFRSRLVGQIAAALMAVSPYGIYLAQEARHYTLTILWIIASLSCLIVAVRCLWQRTVLPIWLGCLWVIVNSLGIATHYFFALVLGAEGLVISAFWLRDLSQVSQRYWWRIYAVGLGTLIGCLVWLPAVQGISGNELTDWIETSFDLDEIWQPIPRLLVWGLTMVFLLPVEGTSLLVAVLSSLVILAVLLWVFPALWRGWQAQMASPSTRLSLQVLAGFLLAAVAIFLLIIYGVRKDISLAARYHFVYFPVVLVVLGSALARCWQDSGDKEQKNRFIPLLPQAQGKKVVVVVLVMGLCGALTVVTNYGYQKSQRSDLLASLIQAKSQASALVAMSYETHSEIRALMGIALDLKRLEPKNRFPEPQFLLVAKRKDRSVPPNSPLAKILTQMPRPLELWGVNLKVHSNDLDDYNCFEDSGSRPKVSGYRYRLYHCR